MLRVVLIDEMETGNMGVVHDELLPDADLAKAIAIADRMWVERWHDDGWGTSPGTEDGGGRTYRVTVAVMTGFTPHLHYIRGRIANVTAVFGYAS